ncbi:MAG: hypothetical protein V9G14_08655 [Cypionkella sp.]
MGWKLASRACTCSLVAVGQKISAQSSGARWAIRRAMMDGRFDIAKRIMGVVGDKAVQRGQKVELEAHAACFIDWPLEQVGLAIPDGIERRQHIKPRVAIELGREDVRLQVLVEGLAQHLLVEMDAVEPGPDRWATSARSERAISCVNSKRRRQGRRPGAALGARQ